MDVEKFKKIRYNTLCIFMYCEVCVMQEMNDIPERYLKKAKLSTSDDPVIFVKNNDTGEYKHWGIKDYKYENPTAFWSEGSSKWDREKTGTLELPFPQNKVIRMENVCSVIITWGKNHIDWGYDQCITLHQGLCRMVPDLEEMEEFHFAIQTVYHDPSTLKKKSDVFFYEGSKLVDKVVNIENLMNFHRSQVYYYIKTPECLVHHIRDFSGEDYIVGKGKHTWHNYDYQWSRNLNKIAKKNVEQAIKQGYFDFYYFTSGSTPDKVLESYICRHYTTPKVDNWFSDDETNNYILRVDITDLTLLSLLSRYGNLCFGIYNIPIDAYLPYLPYESENEWFYRDVYEMTFHKKVLESALCVSEYNNEYELMTALEAIRNRSSEAQKRVVIELLHRLEPGAVKNKDGHYSVPRQPGTKNDMTWSNNVHENASALYFQEKQFLIDNGELNVVWKGEYEMYLLAKKLYPDAIYQYHCDWLGRQSLDVYIPSISVGIEYQGIQHYEPVDHFGGKDAYLHRVELDNQKRQLCAANNVKLLEWRYDSPLTKKGLDKQIKTLVSSD